MKLIQFTCDNTELAQALKEKMTRIVNLLSRLNFLTNDPEYITSPFGTDGWYTHTVETNLHWSLWDAVYANLGDNGRELADEVIIDLIVGQEFNAYPGIILEIVDVENPYAAGYLTPPENPAP